MTRAEWRHHLAVAHRVRQVRLSFGQLLTIHEREHAVGHADHAHDRPEGRR